MKTNDLESAQTMYKRLVDKAVDSNKGIEESTFNEAIEMRMRQALKDHLPRVDHLQIIESRLQAQASQLMEAHARQLEAVEQQWRPKVADLEHRIELIKTDHAHQITAMEQNSVHQANMREAELQMLSSEKVKVG